MSDFEGYLLSKANMSTANPSSVCVIIMMTTLMLFPLQKQLGTTLHKSQQRIDQRVKKWQDLRQAVESVKVSFKKNLHGYKTKHYDIADL